MGQSESESESESECESGSGETGIRLFTGCFLKLFIAGSIRLFH